MGDLLQGTDGRKRLFIDELLRRWKKTQIQPTDTTSLFLPKESMSPTGGTVNDYCIFYFVSTGNVSQPFTTD